MLLKRVLLARMSSKSCLWSANKAIFLEEPGEGCRTIVVTTSSSLAKLSGCPATVESWFPRSLGPASEGGPEGFLRASPRGLATPRGLAQIAKRGWINGVPAKCP